MAIQHEVGIEDAKGKFSRRNASLIGSTRYMPGYVLHLRLCCYFKLKLDEVDK
ncbi:uncharacterized protein TRIREDRAFT_112055, partial [Trichoderma reesei QM6a]